MSRSKRLNHRRAVSPVLAVLLLIVVTLSLVAVLYVGIGSIGPEESPPIARFDLTVDGRHIAITHTHGDPLTIDDLVIHIYVNDEPLAKQPPIPFFSASGFGPGPDGPFNSQFSGDWQSGMTGSLTVAGTNEPSIESGDSIQVRIIYDGSTIAELEDTA